MQRFSVISLEVSTGLFSDFVSSIIHQAKVRQTGVVCVANVHMCIEAWREPSFAQVVNGADIVTPDGKPLAAAIRLLHGFYQPRVAGMDLLPALLAAAEQEKVGVFFYGSTQDVLAAVVTRAARDYPELLICGSWSPPFRALDPVEQVAEVERINNSGASLLFVALGCPKQERWMADHKDKIKAVMVGVGGAFPVYAGLQRRAPAWMQRWALEWLFRLVQEPRRLWRRYLVTNSLFLLLFVRQWLALRLFSPRS